MTRHEIANGFNGPIIAHTTPTGTVALTVSAGHADDLRASATAYLDRAQIAELIVALQDCEAAQWGAALPRATEMGSDDCVDPTLGDA